MWLGVDGKGHKRSRGARDRTCRTCLKDRMPLIMCSFNIPTTTYHQSQLHIVFWCQCL